MLKSVRLAQLARQAPLHERFLTTSPARDFTGRLPKVQSNGTAQRRDFATANLRASRTTRLLHSWRAAPFRRSRQTRWNSSNASSQEAAGQKPLSLSERMKAMSKKYGWTVVGIYLSLSVLDFPFCFLAVRWFGTERIAKIEHAIIGMFWETLEKVAPTLKERRAKNEVLEQAEAAAREGSDAVAADAKHVDPSIWTQLLLAYGVHKSLLFIRIPITLAITPKVVKTLRSWGWKIGKPKTP